MWQAEAETVHSSGPKGVSPWPWYLLDYYVSNPALSQSDLTCPIFSPLFGVSNAYFLANATSGAAATQPTLATTLPTGLPTLPNDPTGVGKEKIMADIPNLLSQVRIKG